MKILTLYEKPVENIVKNLKLTRFLDIIPLSEEEGGKIRQLRRIPKDKPAIFLWGSGFNHGYSFFFDAEGMDLKVNFDAHSDAETKSNSLIHLYLSHMYQSSKKHNCESILYCSRHFHRLTDKGFKLLNETQIGDIQNIGFTIDLDIIHYFPAEKLWWDDSQIYLDELIENIKKAAEIFKGKLIRLDIGGLRENHPISKKEMDFAIMCYNEVLKTGYEIMMR